MNRVYFDHAATTPVHPEVLAAMLPYFSEIFGNASSLHAYGQEAAQAVVTAREQVAQLLNANPREILFTGSGTEADNYALKGTAHKLKNKGNHLITSSIEHHAVLNSAAALEKEGYQVTYLPVDSFGLVDPETLRRAITPQTILISVMFANNEVGTIEPIAELARIAHEKGVLFHTDAVQATGSIPIDVKALGIDMLTLAAHKFYGPKGVGALFMRQGVAVEPLICGGGQERGLRAGTTNVPGIVGLGKAAELARSEMAERAEHSLTLRERLITGLESRLEDYILTGHRNTRLPGNASICVEYIEGESMLLLVDQEGFACSSGSACTSGSLEPSHVLKAMGIDVRLAQGSLRITVGRENTVEETDRFLETLPRVVKRLREMSPFKKK